MPDYTKAQRIILKANTEYTEKWVQNLIKDDPAILGIGDLVLRDVERIQPGAGRLDLLLVDPEDNHRYEVEIQLGATNETHIIRTIEYWDIEKKRYPQYDHTAVIVAEDITSRFLNVISLFSGSHPLEKRRLVTAHVVSGPSPPDLGRDERAVRASQLVGLSEWHSRSCETFLGGPRFKPK